MDHARSFAAGQPPLGHHRTHAGMPAGSADGLVLPAPRPTSLPWSTRIFIAGSIACTIALAAAVAGIPGRLAYDADGPGERVKPTSSNPLAVQAALDRNMKWIDEASSDEPDAYVGHIKSVNENELAIAATAEAIVAMEQAVRTISSGMGDVNATTEAMRASMEHMAQVSDSSAATMSQLDGDIGFLARSMQELASSTGEIVQRMSSVERQADAIAAKGTAAALATTRELNQSLPPEVPEPVYRDGGLQ